MTVSSDVRKRRKIGYIQEVTVNIWAIKDLYISYDDKYPGTTRNGYTTRVIKTEVFDNEINKGVTVQRNINFQIIW